MAEPPPTEPECYLFGAVLRPHNTADLSVVDEADLTTPVIAISRVSSADWMRALSYAYRVMGVNEQDWGIVEARATPWTMCGNAIKLPPFDLGPSGHPSDGFCHSLVGSFRDVKEPNKTYPPIAHFYAPDYGWESMESLVLAVEEYIDNNLNIDFYIEGVEFFSTYACQE